LAEPSKFKLLAPRASVTYSVVPATEFSARGGLPAIAGMADRDIAVTSPMPSQEFLGDFCTA